MKSEMTKEQILEEIGVWIGFLSDWMKDLESLQDPELLFKKIHAQSLRMQAVKFHQRAIHL
jgi:hypothetical protein